MKLGLAITQADPGTVSNAFPSADLRKEATPA